MPDVLSETRAGRLLLHTIVCHGCLLPVGNSKYTFLFTGSADFIIETFTALVSDSIEIIARNAIHKVI